MQRILHTFLDLGVLGEADVDVYYTYAKPFHSRDRETPNEPESVDILAVKVHLFRHQFELLDVLDSDILDNLAIQCFEQVHEGE